MKNIIGSYFYDAVIDFQKLLKNRQKRVDNSKKIISENDLGRK